MAEQVRKKTTGSHLDVSFCNSLGKWLNSCARERCEGAPSTSIRSVIVFNACYLVFYAVNKFDFISLTLVRIRAKQNRRGGNLVMG